MDGAVNATPILCRERAQQQAKTASRNTLLAGLPVVIKDLTEVEGVRCTYGSPIFKDYIPNFSDIPVVNLERHGAVLIGKPTRRNLGLGQTRSTPSLALRETLGISLKAAPGHRADLLLPWQPVNAGWPVGPTWGAACARLPAFVASLGCVPVRAACPVLIRVTRLAP